MIALYKDPEGETVFTSTKARHTSQPSKGALATGNGAFEGGSECEKDQTPEISSLRKRVAQLEETLAKLKPKVGVAQLIY